MKLQFDNVDPLYAIFEQHLCNFHDADQNRKGFVGNIVKEYITFLAKSKVYVPKELHAHVAEELEAQVSVMLTKKIYGFSSIADFRSGLKVELREKATRNYERVVSSKASK